MGERVLLKGNIALAEGAIIAGCRYYFGYPITPQNEVPEYMSQRLPEVGGTYLQAESEVAAINMVFGASAAGARVMTTTSSPGFSLMQEGISYLAAAHLPCVVANIQRGGPGLGNIAPSQADYFQAVKGGGHGDYHMIVLAPNSPQEMMDLTILAFDLADLYRTPVMILTDGAIGQMLESVIFPDNYRQKHVSKPWALTGAKDRNANVIRSLWLDDTGVEENNKKLQEKYQQIEQAEVRYESYMTDNAKIIIIAYGLPARIGYSAVLQAREQGIAAGFFRPISLYPFPYEPLKKLSENGTEKYYVVEMSAGQMVEDVKLAVNGKSDVQFYGTLGGRIPEEKHIIDNIMKIMNN